LTVSVRLTPGARAEKFGGLMETEDGCALKVSVNAPPEDGKANAALIAFLAKSWGIPKSAFSVLSGASSRRKVLLIEGNGATLLEQSAAWAIS
jgi:uncharacterized protein (TIGR00251 family)